ncbi:MAG TPA: type II secretion system protein [Tepidisphaeraceae bacterium]|nr:type II secretion system protein [Tepidisphaeraceae bacterium]
MTASRPRRPDRAFTLVELLVVIGVIALLIGILMPALSKAREQANKTKCLAHLRSLGQAMVLYANDFRDRLPNTNPPGTSNQIAATIQIDYVLTKFRETYARADDVFRCASDRDLPQPITHGTLGLPNSARLSYDFYSVYWVPENGPKLARLRTAPLAWDLKGGQPAPDELQNHGTKGGNVVYSDGHAAWQPAGEWDDWNWPNPAAAQYN